MNIVFHYYALKFLCTRAGCPDDEGDRIARSSQYIDEAIHEYEIAYGGKSYRTVVTQDYVFWDDRICREVYLPYHFFPGNPDAAALVRRDGARNAYAVTPNSEPVKELLVAALRTNDPFRIGIAFHTYADSWAHQNFTGRLEEFNAIGANSLLPPVGHLPALTKPDDHTAVWIDDRLIPELATADNRERYMGAARRIYRYLRTRRKESFEDEDFVLGDLASILDSSVNRSAAIDAFIVDGGVTPYERGRWLAEAGIVDPDGLDERFAGYDKVMWLKAQAERRLGLRDGGRRLISDGIFEGSDLQLWNEAARAHAAAARAVAGNLF
ncbi:MAG: hypothetical protein NT080_04365 [Spirochaetes bacterium]|nr:hypothetical protein [Spirochaetota bacterium]